MLKFKHKLKKQKQTKYHIAMYIYKHSDKDITEFNILYEEFLALT